MLSLFLHSLLAYSKASVDKNTTDVVTEHAIDGMNFIPHVYNNYIGIQNVIVKPEKLLLRSTIDDNSMVRWEIPNKTEEWSFSFTFNELNLNTTEMAGIFLFYTDEKAVVGPFKGGPAKYTGFAVGLEFVGKGVELVYALNNGKDYTNMDQQIPIIDSPNPTRFLNVKALTMKVISTKKNFKVEIYDDETLIYDTFRFFTKEYLDAGKEGKYLSLFAEYKNVASGKAFEVQSAQLYERKEGAGYSTNAVNTSKIQPFIKQRNEILHPNVDVQDMILRMNAITSFIKVMIGELPETAITKAEKELVKEVDLAFDRISKFRNLNSTHSQNGEFSKKINQLDLNFKSLYKKVNEISFILDSINEGKKSKHSMVEYILIAVGLATTGLVVYKEYSEAFQKKLRGAKN
ncbi:hypothetical protein GINT2_000427 [Glugoides intestinalis]